MREFACKVFFSFSVLKKVLFQNLTCQMQDAAYLLMHLVHYIVDKLDELHLGMAHQELVLAYICLGAAN